MPRRARRAVPRRARPAAVRRRDPDARGAARPRAGSRCSRTIRSARKCSTGTDSHTDVFDCVVDRRSRPRASPTRARSRRSSTRSASPPARSRTSATASPPTSKVRSAPGLRAVWIDRWNDPWPLPPSVVRIASLSELIDAMLTVGFDLDMTLVDSRPGIRASMDALARETGVPIDVDVVIARLGPKLEWELAQWFPADQVDADVRALPRALLGSLRRRRHGAARRARAPRSTRCTRTAVASLIVTAKSEPLAYRCLETVGLQGRRGRRPRARRREARRAARARRGVYVGDTGHRHHVGARRRRDRGRRDDRPRRRRDSVGAAGADLVLGSLDGLPAWLDTNALTSRAARRAARRRSAERRRAHEHRRGREPAASAAACGTRSCGRGDRRRAVLVRRSRDVVRCRRAACTATVTCNASRELRPRAGASSASTSTPAAVRLATSSASTATPVARSRRSTTTRSRPSTRTSRARA